MTHSLKISTPFEKSYSKVITNEFIEKADSFSLKISQENLSSGMYLRDRNGRYLESFFTGHHINDALKKYSDDNIEWPNIDIVIDLETRTIFADKGKFHLKFYHSEEEREPKTFFYFYDGQSSYSLQSGWLSLGWHDFTQSEYGKWITYLSEEGKKVYTECLEGSDGEFSGVRGQERISIILAMLTAQRYFSYKDKILEMNGPVNLGKFIPAKYSLERPGGFKSGLILPPLVQG